MTLLFCTTLEPTKANGATIYTTRILRALHDLGIKINVAMIQIYSGDAPPNEIQWQSELNELKDKGVEFAVFSAKPRPVSFLKAYVKLISHVLTKKRIRNVNVFAFRVFYFQPLVVLFKIFRRRTLTLWFHEGVIEELYFVHPDMKHRLMVIFIKVMERVCAPLLDWEFPVSEQMKQYSTSRKIQGRKGSVVLPCIVETDKFTPKKKTLSEQKIIIGYAGSMAAWHGFQESCEFLKRLNSSYEIKIHVLTYDLETAHRIANGLNLENIIESASHEQVPNKMAQWDFALVPIRGGLRTQVCSPLKATEALAMGLPLIITPGVGDFTDIVMKEGIGIAFDPDNEMSWPSTINQFECILDNYSAISQKARSIAVERFSYDVLRLRLKDVLRSCDFKRGV